MSAKSEIEKLAGEIAKAAMQPGVDLQQKLDALKVLAPYYTLWKKKDGDTPPDDGSSLAGMIDKIHEAEDDRPNFGLRDRRRNQ